MIKIILSLIILISIGLGVYWYIITYGNMNNPDDEIAKLLAPSPGPSPSPSPSLPYQYLGGLIF